MRTEYIFPTVLIALDVCAAMPYKERLRRGWSAARAVGVCNG